MPLSGSAIGIIAVAKSGFAEEAALPTPQCGKWTSYSRLSMHASPGVSD